MLWMDARGVQDSIDCAGIFEVIPGEGTEKFSTDLAQGPLLCNYIWERLSSQESMGSI